MYIMCAKKIMILTNDATCVNTSSIYIYTYMHTYAQPNSASQKTRSYTQAVRKPSPQRESIKQTASESYERTYIISYQIVMFIIYCV